MKPSFTQSFGQKKLSLFWSFLWQISMWRIKLFRVSQKLDLLQSKLLIFQQKTSRTQAKGIHQLQIGQTTNGAMCGNSQSQPKSRFLFGDFYTIPCQQKINYSIEKYWKTTSAPCVKVNPKLLSTWGGTAMLRMTFGQPTTFLSINGLGF